MRLRAVRIFGLLAMRGKKRQTFRQELLEHFVYVKRLCLSHRLELLAIGDGQVWPHIGRIVGKANLEVLISENLIRVAENGVREPRVKLGNGLWAGRSRKHEREL